MRHIFFIALITAFTFSINGMDDVATSFSTPPRPVRADVASPVLPDLTPQEINSLTELMQRSFEQIRNVHAIFSPSPDTGGDKPEIATAAISRTFMSLIPLFLARLNPVRGKHITPECRKALGSHVRDIAGDDPKDFVRKGEADFLKSINPQDFYTIITHFGNLFFVPRWQMDPEFALWRKSTRTLLGGIHYSSYNIIKMLKGENPESHSGVLEHHHVYQNQGTVTPVCWSEHKGKTKQYHKSESESEIDRGICGPEFYFINKLTALLQIAHMCERVLRAVDEEALTAEALTLMNAIRNYTGNITIIPNGAETIKRKPKLEIQDAFATARTLNLVDGGVIAPQKKAEKRRADPLEVAEFDDKDDEKEAESLSPAKKEQRIEVKRRAPLSSLPINIEDTTLLGSFYSAKRKQHEDPTKRRTLLSSISISSSVASLPQGS